jgi:hypothetical protein
VSQDNVIKLIQPRLFDDQLTKILRNGAHALRSVSDEAIHSFFAAMDCFASLAMTHGRSGGPTNERRHSTLRLDALMIGHQRSLSAFWNARKASGDCWAGGVI